MKRKTPKPRNPYVQHVVSKKAGPHSKPYKTQRAAVKRELSREYR
jgi:hypothetical protein